MPPEEDEYTMEDIEMMTHDILTGNLRIKVYNKNLEKEVKRLALNPHSRRISLLRDDGLCDDSWEISSLRCIVQGIDTSILADPPPQDMAVAFRFRLSEDGSEEQDLFLCVVFDSAIAATLATQAFCDMCEVDVVQGRPT